MLVICLELLDRTLWNSLTNAFTGHRLWDKSLCLSFVLTVVLKGLYHLVFVSMDTQLITRIPLEVTWSIICCSVVSKEQPAKKISSFISTVVNVPLCKFSYPLISENLLILPLRGLTVSASRLLIRVTPCDAVLSWLCREEVLLRLSWCRRWTVCHSPLVLAVDSCDAEACWLCGEDDTVVSLARDLLATVANKEVSSCDVEVALLVALLGEHVDVVAAVIVFVLCHWCWLVWFDMFPGLLTVLLGACDGRLAVLSLKALA